MDDLSAALRRERELLDRLRFRFVETRLLLAAADLRYVGFATEEIHQARVRAREADLLRAAHVQRLGERWGRQVAPTLRELAGSADQPWAGILRDHHEGLCAIISEIEVIGHRNAELARAGLHDLATRSGSSLFAGWPGTRAEGEEAVIELTPQTITLEQAMPSSDHARQLAEEQAYQEVIATGCRLRMPALLAFLR